MTGQGRWEKGPWPIKSERPTARKVRGLTAFGAGWGGGTSAGSHKVLGAVRTGTDGRY